MPICKIVNGKAVCGPEGSAGSRVEIFPGGVPNLRALPDIERIAEGVMGRNANMSDPSFLTKLGTSTDIGVRQIAFYQGLSQGIPRVGGQFFQTSELSRKNLLENNPAFLSSFANVPLTDSKGNVSSPELIFDKFGRGMAEVFGAALSRLTGDALKSGSLDGVPFVQMFNNVWDQIPMQAIPILGSIIKGFVKVIVNGVMSQGRSGKLDSVHDLPEFNPNLDLSYAQDVLDQLNASDNDLTPIWSPPGPVLDDIGNRHMWHFGFDDIKMKDQTDRTWWGFGSVNEFGFEPARFAPYANSPQDYGRSSPIALGAIPGMSFVHSALVASKNTGYDLGKLLPTAGNIAGDLWFQVASPAGPQIWRIWPDKLFDRWVKYLSAMRRAIHLTYNNTSPEAPRSRILSTSNKKGNKWSYYRDYRRQLVNAGHEVFGWKKWCDLDDELFDKGKGGGRPEKSLDFYADNFGIYTSVPVLATTDMKINQYGAADLVTCAYAHPNSPALARNSELRDKVDENKRALLTSEKLHLVDEDMVHEPELAQAIRQAKQRMAQQSMTELWAAPDPDQVLETQVRASRLRDMLIKETEASGAVTGEPTPLRDTDFSAGPSKSMKRKTKKKSGGGVGLLVAAAAGVAILGKGKG